MLENKFQSKLIKEIETRFPGCVVMKNDASYRQGFPDITVFYKDKWASLEVKKSRAAHHQPNQDYWVSMLNTMSYANFIYPENKEEILDEIQRTFGFER